MFSTINVPPHIVVSQKSSAPRKTKSGKHSTTIWGAIRNRVSVDKLKGTKPDAQVEAGIQLGMLDISSMEWVGIREASQHKVSPRKSPHRQTNYPHSLPTRRTVSSRGRTRERVVKSATPNALRSTVYLEPSLIAQTPSPAPSTTSTASTSFTIATPDEFQPQSVLPASTGYMFYQTQVNELLMDMNLQPSTQYLSQYDITGGSHYEPFNCQPSMFEQDRSLLHFMSQTAPNNSYDHWQQQQQQQLQISDPLQLYLSPATNLGFTDHETPQLSIPPYPQMQMQPNISIAAGVYDNNIDFIATSQATRPQDQYILPPFTHYDFSMAGPSFCS